MNRPGTPEKVFAIGLLLAIVAGLSLLVSAVFR